jgi:hypothetical protein
MALISIKIPMKNGITHIITSAIEPRLRTPCTIYKFIPTGGVRSANSHIMTINTPNQIGSIPIATTGYR